MSNRLFAALSGIVICLVAAAPQAKATAVDGILASVPQFTKVAKLIGPAPPTQLVRLVMFLPYPNKPAVDAFTSAVNDPSSSTYGRFLTPAQFTASFGPSGNSYSMVEYLLAGAGFKVYKTYANRKVVDVIGTVGQAEVLFQTIIAQYKYNGVTYYANQGPALAPTVLKGVVMAVGGLNNFARKAIKPIASLKPIGYGPLDIQTAYDEPVHVNGAISGAGRTIAIETTYDYLDSDLQSFWAAFGVHRTGAVTRRFIADPVNQGLPLPGQNDETTLDVEQTSSSAPGANVEVVEAGDALNATFDDMYESTASDPSIDVVTTSWGSCEIGADPNEETADNDLFEEGAAQGQTMFAATGDNGSKDCGTNSPPYGLPGQPNPTTVDFPASSPWVAAAGGTTLTLKSNRTIASETAWSGTGGGVSMLFGLPVYQANVSGLASTTHRNTPDVALDADPNTPYALYLDGQFAVPVGGTSAVGPNLAAMYAQFDGYRQHRSGLAQAALYSGFPRHTYPGLAWHDIVSGGNGAYHAHAGYDNVSGVGSLDAYRYMLGMPASRYPSEL